MRRAKWQTIWSPKRPGFIWSRKRSTTWRRAGVLMPSGLAEAHQMQPDGTQVPLIEIDDWDFHWQGFYDYVNPVPIPYRSTITGACVWDNTSDHVIRWGESTEDEMCVLFLGFTAEGGLAPLLFGNPQ